MTDMIFITGVVIHARHGVMDHETEVGQRFVIDLELSTDLSESSRTDRLADTVSYSNVVATATAAFKNANYKLLERAAGAVADAVLAAIPRILLPLHGMEKKLGRDRAGERRGGPRPRDLDLTAYDEVSFQKPDLPLPPPRLFERAFVLVPLAEIAPDRLIAGQSVAAALAQLSTEGILRLPDLG